jgi:predicted  nucleic acid-binding Zn-ribbon protein
MTSELKKKDHLLETAKRSKAEEFVSLQREGTELKRREGKLEKELDELRTTLEQLNR